jgi:replicative DNA helicase
MLPSSDLDVLEQEALIARAQQDGWDIPAPFYDVQLPAFPSDALPTVLRAFVEALAIDTQTPVDMPAMLSIAAVATATQKRFGMVDVKPGCREPLNLYAVVVMGPANRKSAVVRAVAAPIERFERDENERLRPEIQAAAVQYAINQKRVLRAQETAAKANDPKEQRQLDEEAKQLAIDAGKSGSPSPPRLLADDATPEKLISLLQENGGRMSVISAEAVLFAVMCGRYSKNGEANLSAFLNAHAGDTIRVDRRGRESEHIDSPALTIAVAIQPDVVRRLMEKPELRGEGMLARLLFSVPRSYVGTRDVDPPPVPVSVRADYEAMLTALLQAKPPDECVLQLSEEARTVHRDFRKRLEPRLGQSGDLEPIRDWAGKLAGAAVRIAGNLHCADLASRHPWEHQISGETMERALRICDYLTAHALGAFVQLGGDEQTAMAQRCIRWMQSERKQHFSGRDLFNAFQSRFRKMDATGPIVSLLKQHGCIRLVDQVHEGPGRPPSPTYEVNPLLHASGSVSAYSACSATPDLSEPPEPEEAYG